MTAPESERLHLKIQALRRLAAEQPLPLTVRGDCMAPGLAAGAAIEVLARRRYWPGDVVAFLGRDGRLLVHRVIGYRPRAGRWEIVTQADTAPRADAPVEPECILGRLASGDCAPRLVNVPVGARLSAVGRFARLLVRRAGARLRRALAPGAPV